MRTTIELLSERIEDRWLAPSPENGCGATVEFRGVVRGEEAGQPIAALRYEAYQPMAEHEIGRILADEDSRHPCERVVVLHRHGWIPVGEMAILVWIESRHRGEAFALLAAFMDRLKIDVPIWKVETR